jgi:hypothetical protein
MKSIEVMHRQIKNILSVLIEGLHQAAESFLNTTESERTLYEKRIYLCKQAMKIAKWIENFNPNSIDLLEKFSPKIQPVFFKNNDYMLKPLNLTRNSNLQNDKFNVNLRKDELKRGNADLRDSHRLNPIQTIDSLRSLNRTSQNEFPRDESMDKNKEQMFKSVDNTMTSKANHHKNSKSFELQNRKTVRVMRRQQLFLKRNKYVP